ncbi:hypothetical protein ASF34_21040 [Methylobacterium sp. Leaf106]|nr:hypothetical protein ASF34_21040 [Methylobacterium sp. Leaf106]
MPAFDNVMIRQRSTRRLQPAYTPLPVARSMPSRWRSLMNRRRNSSTVANSTRPSRLPPEIFSERMTPQPSAFNRATCPS